MKTLCLEDDLYPGEMPGILVPGELAEAIDRVHVFGWVPKRLEYLEVYITLDRKPIHTRAVYLENQDGLRSAILMKSDAGYELRACPSID